MSEPIIVVAGHVCLDIIPRFGAGPAALAELLAPGKLVNVGPATLSTGGAVANTGLALHRLGLPTRLAGKVGDDAFGRAILDIFRAAGPHLAAGMHVDPAAATSYTVVINPPGMDRLFLHCPGANDTYEAADLDPAVLAGAAICHFGYPPLMKRMYEDDGSELAALLATVRRAGVTTSLDMALPDPASEAGRADWTTILRRALPQVDLFVPSLEELVFMLDPAAAAAVRSAAAAGIPLGGLQPRDVTSLAQRAIDLGAAVVLIKLGTEGACLTVTRDARRLRDTGAARPADPAAWLGAHLGAACYDARVAGTTGAGDCTIAGFLAAFGRGCRPDECLRYAVAAGSASVEQPDATSGIPSWPALTGRMNSGWRRMASRRPFVRQV